MTDTTWPVLEQPVNEAEWRLLAGNLPEGVLDAPGGTGLLVTAPGTSMSVSAAAGAAVVQGFGFQRDAAAAVAIAASTPLPRIDIIILRYTPGFGVALTVLQGAPAASPVAPAVTQVKTGVWEKPLAYVNVRANTTTILNSDVTDARRFAGRAPVACTSGNRPTGVQVPQMIYETDTQKTYIWNGSGWQLIAAPPNYVATKLVGSVAESGANPQNLVISDVQGGWTGVDAYSTGDVTRLVCPEAARYRFLGWATGDGTGAVEVRKGGVAMFNTAFPNTATGDQATIPVAAVRSLAAGDQIEVWTTAGSDFTLHAFELVIERI